ncbi:hypothetical protein TNCV_625681 [Trichonephila clavipes]|nr:hypothetical protein TNCV_625681 [Trichonephila clavipes]
MAPWARQLRCVLACYAPIGKEEVKRDFGDLRIRRSEGHLETHTLVFKRVLFEETKTGKKGANEKKKRKELGKKRRADRWREAERRIPVFRSVMLTRNPKRE